MSEFLRMMQDQEEAKVKKIRAEIRNEHRIEALRAASRVVAGIYAGGKHAGDQGEKMGAVPVTLEVADAFLGWLEDG